VGSFATGFREFDIATTACAVHGVIGGSGPPLLLLHGMPETHIMWRQVASVLAGRFTVIATDLRGHGHSSAPDPATTDYSMRSLAVDQLEAMDALGFTSFSIAGHDRGARCAYRLAADHPTRVRALAVIDVIPTGDAFERADWRFATGFWVWSFLAAPGPIAEQLIAGNPDAFVDHMLGEWAGAGFAFSDEVRGNYVEQFRDPARVRAICAQYRAAASQDRELDLHERAAHPIQCPTLALWSAGGPVDTWYDPLAVWREWAGDLSGKALVGGHFLPEESPEAVAAELDNFLAGT
jgi:haloacetate dehalogenase